MNCDTEFDVVDALDRPRSRSSKLEMGGVTRSPQAPKRLDWRRLGRSNRNHRPNVLLGIWQPAEAGHDQEMKMGKWGDDCDHEWELAPGDWDAAEDHSYVECKKCGVPGDRTDSTGEVYWPAT